MYSLCCQFNLFYIQFMCFYQLFTVRVVYYFSNSNKKKPKYIKYNIYGYDGTIIKFQQSLFYSHCLLLPPTTVVKTTTPIFPHYYTKRFLLFFWSLAGTHYKSFKCYMLYTWSFLSVFYYTFNKHLETHKPFKLKWIWRLLHIPFTI